MFKKIILLIAIVVCLGLGLYFTYFHRPPTADILAANLALHDRQETGDCSPGGNCDDEDDEVVDGSPAKQSARMWRRWLKENKHVSIGQLYDKCNGSDKIMVGQVIMLPDEINGGVTSTTFLNVTIDKTITGGLMYLTCQYNGNDLYSNHWDLCTADEGTEDRIIICPIRTGKKKFVKNLKIPNYLPKGRYTTKAWMTTQDDEMIGCAFADFAI